MSLRREDNVVVIRNNRREESLLKKRREGLQAQQMPPTIQSTGLYKKLEHLTSMVAGVWAEDVNLQLEPTTQFRKLFQLVSKRSPPIEEVIQFVPRFVEFLMRESAPQLQVQPSLPALASLINYNDEEVLADACCALYYFSDGTNDKIQAVIGAGVCGRLIELLMHPSSPVLVPALRPVGNIVTGDYLQTQILIIYIQLCS